MVSPLPPILSIVAGTVMPGTAGPDGLPVGARRPLRVNAGPGPGGRNQGRKLSGDGVSRATLKVTCGPRWAEARFAA